MSTMKFTAHAADGSIINIFDDLPAARKAIVGKEGACVRNAAGDIVAFLPAKTLQPYRGNHRAKP